MAKFIKVLSYANVVILTFVLILMLSACAGRTQYVYQEVKVPVKCQAKKPEKPVKTNNNFEYLKNILIYTEQLEIIVDGCVE